MMINDWTLVRAVDHSFGVLDSGLVPAETSDYSTGLTITMDIGARIHTGIDTGPVRVRATVAGTQPTEALDSLGAWSEIIETSIHAPHGRLRVESLATGPVEELPLLSSEGSGWYRMRVCTRGRDTAFDAVVTEPVEDYHLTIWPAAYAPPTIIRASDRCGQSLRQASVGRASRPPTIQQESQDRIDAEDRAAVLRRQTLLRAAGNPTSADPAADTHVWRPEPPQPAPGPR